MIVMLLNAGSSSLKAALVESNSGEVIASCLAEWASPQAVYHYTGADNKEQKEKVSWKGYGKAVERFNDDIASGQPAALPDRKALAAVGHRVVHGGAFTSSVRITPEVRERINELADLAPLHNPPSLETLSAAQTALPDVPHIAVFDTAFHAGLPPHATTYAVPEQWTREWGIRRYGFHGLSLSYCSVRAAEMLRRPLEELRLVICHLGHGCSATAVQGGRSVETTMGFTPLEGLMMGTRSGSVDPGVLCYVQQHHGLSSERIETILNRESGLLGVSGIGADMREVLAAAKNGHKQAKLALAVYAHRARQAVGALTVTLGGVDALVFTGGVGEHAAEVRSSITAGLECLGLVIDPIANLSNPDADIAAQSSPGRILIITTREDISMLREVESVLGEKAAK